MNATHRDDRRFFERLCLLRSLYERRGRRDREAVMSVADGVRYAEWLLTRPAVPSV